MTSAPDGLTLVLGGVRAGKTRFAERLAARYGGRVCYVATAEPGDDEMRARIAAHRASRPAGWLTVEASRDVAGALGAIERPDALLLDCLTVWASNVLLDRLDPDAPSERGVRAAEAAATAAVDALLDWRRAAGVPLIVVSNEVGLGVMPPFPLGRVFQDVLGRLNQRLAAGADEVYLVVAGLALPLKRLGAHALDQPPPLPRD
jgi:adenosylcobinamide kinase/adenosylcobinamide-phosphate guanylyltransferase